MVAFDLELMIYFPTVHRKDLKALSPLGAGQFGQVYRGLQTVARGKGDEGTNKCKRAVKTLRGAASELDRDEFVHEAEIMLQLNHPQLVSLIGVAVQQRPWLMVLEYCPSMHCTHADS